MSTHTTGSEQVENDGTFFEKERVRLIGQIATNFEDLLSQSNVLNRQLEQIYGVGSDFATVAALWGRFQDLMKEQREEVQAAAEDEQGIPGTGTAFAGQGSIGAGATKTYSTRGSTLNRSRGESVNERRTYQDLTEGDSSVG